MVSGAPVGDRGRVLGEQRVEALGLGDAVHEADALRLGGVEAARR